MGPSSSPSPASLPPKTAGLVVEAAGLGYAYGERPVLEEISLRLDPGEVVGLLGPNGSGKSTLVRLLSGVLTGYGGSLRLDGRELSTLDRREIARRVAVVPQEPSFSLPFTVEEIVLMGRHAHQGAFAFDSAADRAIARGALESCGAAPLAGRFIHELSSGERQRVVFARALAQEPRVLLLDEPASFLDIRYQIELYQRVRGLARRGLTVLTVLHDLNMAALYCDRVILLRSGRVAAAGTLAEVFTRDHLSRVFETDLLVERNPATGRLLVIPLAGDGRGESLDSP